MNPKLERFMPMSNEKDRNALDVLLLLLLVEREWEETDGRKHVICITCGARHSVKKKLPWSHRKGCEFLNAINALKALCPLDTWTGQRGILVEWEDTSGRAILVERQWEETDDNS